MFELPMPEPAGRVLSVAALLLAAGDALAARLGAVAVRGEISGFSRAASGHCYLSLKDGGGTGALVRCVLFRRAAVLLDFEPRDGMQVDVRGRVSIYEPRGELQLVVEAMRRVGVGSLYEEFVRLRSRLEREGLFDPQRKRPVPAMPRQLAVVTSPAAAAWQDVMASLRRRSPQVEVVLLPTPVQGVDAPEAICEALRRAGDLPGLDAVLLVRGGGSLEDLWAFNDERVVRAVRDCAVPVICGVGHESDVTLADLAADLRAATPTAAAELAAPDRGELVRALDNRQRLLLHVVVRSLERHAQRLDVAARRLGPAASQVQAQRQQCETRGQRLRQALRSLMPIRAAALAHRAGALARSGREVLRREQAALAAASARLAALDPHAVLERGYVWMQDESGRAVTSAAVLAAGQALKASWSDGVAAVRVEGIEVGAAWPPPAG